MLVRLSWQARQDLDGIRDYTVQTWSREQWLTYFARMTAAFDTIATDPTCGRPRDLFLAKMRSLAVERHLVFFIPSVHAGGAVAIVRIIHQRQNLSALNFCVGLD